MYVAPYLMFAMFFSAYLWITAWREKRATKATAWGYGILIALFFLFFILSQTRGALLGLGLGGLVFLLYLVFVGTPRERKWSGIALIILFVLAGIFFAAQNTSLVKNSPIGRLAQFNLQSQTVETRLWVWGEAWQGFLERPVFGFGTKEFYRRV